MVYEKGKEPKMETARDYTTGADTFVPAFTKVEVVADRRDQNEELALVRYEGMISLFQIPYHYLRERYTEVYPVKKGEDPLESDEFVRRSQDYRHADRGQAQVTAWQEMKDFIRHHYVRRSVNP